MIQYWFRYNWHWLSAAFVFSVGVLSVAISTKFKEKWAYEALMLFFLLTAMAIMSNFLWRMRAGKFTLLEHPCELPRPSFLMMVLCTVGGICGYLYMTVLKFSLYLDDCLIVVEKFKGNKDVKVLIDILDEDEISMWLCPSQRICLCLFLAISCFYIIQRSKVDVTGKWEQILANVLNFFFAVFFFKAVCNEAYLLIEDYCYQPAALNGVPFLSKFCPNEQIPRYNFSSDKIIYCFNKTENETKINDEQRSWVNVHSRVLRDVTLSIFTELMPILLVCHLLSNGNALKIVRKETMKSMKNNKNVISIWVGVDNSEDLNYGKVNVQPVPKSMPELKLVWLLRLLSMVIPVISIITWNGSFLHSLIHHDLLHQSDTNENANKIGIYMTNLSLLLITKIFALFLFGMVANWTRKIPTDLIDLAKKATSGADKYLMWGGLFFLAISKICFLGQFVMFFAGTNVGDTHGNKTHDIQILMNMPNEHMTMANIILILYKVTTIICQFLSTIALTKIATLSTAHLKEFKQILPILSICGMFFNANCFFQIYFFMERSKKLSEFIQDPNAWNSIVLLLYEAECLTKIGGYLHNMTSALAWFDIVMRYMEMDYFNLAKFI